PSAKLADRIRDCSTGDCRSSTAARCSWGLRVRVRPAEWDRTGRTDRDALKGVPYLVGTRVPGVRVLLKGTVVRRPGACRVRTKIEIALNRRGCGRSQSGGAQCWRASRFAATDTGRPRDSATCSERRQDRAWTLVKFGLRIIFQPRLSMLPLLWRKRKVVT